MTDGMEVSYKQLDGVLAGGDNVSGVLPADLLWLDSQNRPSALRKIWLRV